MHDMIVRLTDLPDISKKEIALFKMEGIIIKRPIPSEKSIVVRWVDKPDIVYHIHRKS